MREIGRKGGKEVQRQRNLRDTKQVRHAYDKPGPAKGRVFGVAAITQALSGLEFPATKEDVLEKVGNQAVQYRKGQEIELRPILEAVDLDEFPSIAQIVEAVSASLSHEGMTRTQRSMPRARRGGKRTRATSSRSTRKGGRASRSSR